MTTTYKQIDAETIQFFTTNDDGSITNGPIVNGRTRTRQVQTGAEEVEVGFDEDENVIYETQPVLADEVYSPWDELMATNPIIEPVEIPVLTQADYSQAAQLVLDTQAILMGYDSIFTAISYEGDAFAKFNDEALALKAWRSQVWQHAYSLLDQVESGEIDPPTLENFKNQLPKFGE